MIRECAYQKDFQEEISDIKFSPSNTCLAVGSHDDFIIIYSCSLTVDGSTRYVAIPHLHVPFVRECKFYYSRHLFRLISQRLRIA